jgi:hypothetical protein
LPPTGNFILRFIGQRLDLAQYVITALCGLFGLVTKLGWFDADEFQGSFADISAFLQVTLFEQ